MKTYTKQKILQVFDEELASSRRLLSASDYEPSMVHLLEHHDLGALFFLRQLGVLSKQEYDELFDLICQRVRYTKHGN